MDNRQYLTTTTTTTTTTTATTTTATDLNTLPELTVVATLLVTIIRT